MAQMYIIDKDGPLAIDPAGLTNVLTFKALYNDAVKLSKSTGFDPNELLENIGFGWAPKDFRDNLRQYSVPQVQQHLGGISKEIDDIENGALLGPDASMKQIERVYRKLQEKKQEKALLEDLLKDSEFYIPELTEQDYLGLLQDLHEAAALMLDEPRYIQSLRDKHKAAEQYIEGILPADKVRPNARKFYGTYVESDSPDNHSEKKSGISINLGGKGLRYLVAGIVIAAGAVVSGCLGSGDSTAKEKVQINQYAGEVTATSTPASAQVAASDSKIPPYLGISKDWRDRVVGNLNLPAEGAGLKRTAGGDDQYDDNEIVVGDGVAEMMAGIDVENNDIIVVYDNDFLKEYGRPPLAMLDKVNDGNPVAKKGTEISPGLYYVKVPIDGNDRMVFLGKQANSIEEEKDIPGILFKKG